MKLDRLNPWLGIVANPAVVSVTAALASEGLWAQSPVFRTDSAEVDGIRLQYRVGGGGPPLLLLHGFTGAGVWWNPYLEDLAESYTTIVPDLPGHGRSEGGPDPYRFDEVATDVFALMDELGIDRFRAVGYSGGGIVLLHMATQDAGRIESMALVSAPHVHSRSTFPEFPSFEEHPAEAREYWMEIHPGGEAQVRRLISSFRGLGELAEEMDIPPEELAGLEARTFVVLGDRDPLFPVRLGVEMYESIPSAALWVVPMQGHSAIWPEWGGSGEAASIFPAVLRRFLDSEPLRTPPEDGRAMPGP